MHRLLRSGVILLAVASVPKTANAEWQLKPFGGITFGGGTTFYSDLDKAAGKRKLNLGVSALWLGEVVGLEGDVATTAGFFSGDSASESRLILRSHVATVTGNVVVALPKRLAQYSLRPYAVGGLGAMQIGVSDQLSGLGGSIYRSAWDVGGGATGFLSDFVGVNWDVRFFKTTSGETALGRNLAQGTLSFWRATMGFAVRL